MSNITLPWMNKIRQRIIEVAHSGLEGKPVLHPEVEKFIRPIMEYGESEEKRINKAFEEDTKRMHMGRQNEIAKN